MTDDRTFKFESGYTIRVKDSYDPRHYRMTLEEYREKNPPPEPPLVERKRKIKGGFKIDHIQDYDDERYLRSYSIWETEMYRDSTNTLYEMAIDPDSIDKELLAAGREWAEQNGIGVSSDDVRAYFHFVVTPSAPEVEYKDTEQGKFMLWLGEVGGPSEALVSKFVDTFRAGVSKQTHLQRASLANGRTQQMEAEPLAHVQ